MRKNKSLLGVNLFQKTHELEKTIELFLHNIVTAGQHYTKAMSIYFQSGVNEAFLSEMSQVTKLERENDAFRREAENNMYAHVILPDMRSDVLRLLEGCDRVINKYESNLLLMSVEKPEILSEQAVSLLDLVFDCVASAGNMVEAARLFFKGIDVSNSTTAVFQKEHEADKRALALKKYVFETEIELARKIQLKEFIYHIEKISDVAEDMGDFIKIMAVKHGL